MNLSYLFRQKVQLGLILGAAAYFLTQSIYMSSITETVISAILIISGVLNYQHYNRTVRLNQAIQNILNELRHGNTEDRLAVHTFPKEFATLCTNVNAACDIVDVMLRESQGSMQAMLQGIVSQNYVTGTARRVQKKRTYHQSNH